MFIEEHLQELRRRGFRPRALAAYARHVGGRVRADILANPAATRSIWIVALGFVVVAFVLSAAVALRGDLPLAERFFLATVLATLASCALAGLGVGQLRDRDGYPLSAITIPCVLTLARVIALPGIVLFLLDGRLAWALGGFVAAGLTDVADGWVARRFRQESRLGTILDPIVDIVFNFTVFGALAAAGLIPAWVLAAAASRYTLLLAGGAYIYLFHGPVRIAPTVFGRLSGVAMSVLVGLRLLVGVAGAPLSDRVGHLTEIALGVLLGMAAVQAVAMGWYNLRLLADDARAARRVIDSVEWRAS